MAAQRLIEYQALLSQPQTIALIEQRRREIKLLGGQLEIDPPQRNGIRVVVLRLPEGVRPGELFPGMPFYAV